MGTALADIRTDGKDDWKKELKFLDLGLELVHAKLVQSKGSKRVDHNGAAVICERDTVRIEDIPLLS